MPRNRNPAASDLVVFQFKITLLGIEPEIWRRIQVFDGSLEDLHDHIQGAMGWENAHLHQFEIDRQRYSNHEYQLDGWEDDDSLDANELRLSELLSRRRKSLRFSYEYDFGDGWRHQIAYEGKSAAESGVDYPRCIDGARACPPEDCGGPWNYPNVLAAMRDPDHEQYEHWNEWIGEFDSERFDVATATRRMQHGRCEEEIGD
ncbi:MAG: plasmid pRiA4b ORF-3 family protein [Pirellulales bacterium]